MFFKNIENWTKQKLRGLNILFSLLHFTALVLVPVIITGVNYRLFSNSTGGLKLTAVGSIIVVILGLYAYIKMKKVIDDLPEIKVGQQRFKFTIQAILSLLPIIIIIIAIQFAKKDFNTAMNVLQWSSVSFACGILIDGLLLKYIKAELTLRSKALELVEIEKRKKLV